MPNSFIWHNFKGEISLRKVSYIGHVIDTEMPTKACYTGHGCFPLNRLYILLVYRARDVLSKDLHSSGMLLWVFSSQETFLCSDLSPGVVFVINFLWNGNTWAANSNAGGAVGNVPFALFLHFYLSISGRSQRQGPDQGGCTSILEMLFFFTPNTLPPHLCAEKLIEDIFWPLP